MSGYPLLSLEPIQLEKVISKMKDRSYFRLQQTCKDLEQFIQTSKLITVDLDMLTRLRSVFDEEKKSWNMRLTSKSSGTFPITVEETEAFHGIRVREFNAFVGPNPGQHNGYESLCDYLKAHRISCQELLLHAGMTEEQVLTLADILKPRRIRMKSRGNTLYETIFLCKTVKEISQLSIDENAAPIATEKFLAKYPKISIHFISDLNSLAVVRNILQIVLSKPWQNLREYHLEVQFDDWKTFSKEELEQELNSFKMVADVNPHASGSIKMPSYFPQGSILIYKATM